MEHIKIDLDRTHSFSDTFLSYVGKDDLLRPFYTDYPFLENFEQQLRRKSSFPMETRSLLVTALQKQYEKLNTTDSVRQNITALGEKNTYTVTTGHQLNLFTGPLYVIYKLVTTIRACQELSDKYPGYTFVPVYWMATEDHDFDEINHFFFNNQRYEWLTDQQGAVGRFDLKDIQPLLKEFAAFPDFMLEAYRKNTTLAAAVCEYMDHLFGEYGLVTLDADDSILKKLFTGVMKRDLVQQDIEPLVRQTSQQMTDAGFKPQVNAREINFFYLGENYRARLDAVDGKYHLAERDEQFTQEEMAGIIRDRPGKLSPNVILRPLYQEMILPNLAYCGGPSEITYWLQLKPVFENFDIPFPLLLPRNFCLIIPEHMARKWKKTGFDWPDLFSDRHHLTTTVTLRDSDKRLHLNGQKSTIEEQFKEIHDQALVIDPTLGPHVEAQWAQTKKRLDKIEKKFIRAEKKQHADEIRQVEEVLAALFPDGTLQERRDNFLNFYQTDHQLIGHLMDHLDPFDFRFNVLIHGE